MGDYLSTYMAIQIITHFNRYTDLYKLCDEKIIIQLQLEAQQEIVFLFFVECFPTSFLLRMNLPQIERSKKLYGKEREKTD